MDHQEEQQLYKLLRLSLRLTQEFPVEVDADGWRRLYQTAIRQSLVGVCYQGVRLLPEGSKPPLEIAMQWASEAESIKGMNELLYQCRSGNSCSKHIEEITKQIHKRVIQSGSRIQKTVPNNGHQLRDNSKVTKVWGA